MATLRADQLLHVDSAARAKEANRRHRSGAQLTCKQELREDCRRLSPLPAKKRHAPARDQCLFALSRFICADRHRQVRQHILGDHLASLHGNGL